MRISSGRSQILIGHVFHSDSTCDPPFVVLFAHIVSVAAFVAACQYFQYSAAFSSVINYLVMGALVLFHSVAAFAYPSCMRVYVTCPFPQSVAE